MLESLKPVSKAVASAIAAVLAGVAVKYLGTLYTPEVGAAISTLVDVIATATIGFVIAYLAPKNTSK